MAVRRMANGENLSYPYSLFHYAATPVPIGQLTPVPPWPQ
jgi:hypothetical protein